MGIVLGKFEKRLQRKKTASTSTLDDCGALTEGEYNETLKVADSPTSPTLTNYSISEGNKKKSDQQISGRSIDSTVVDSSSSEKKGKSIFCLGNHGTAPEVKAKPSTISTTPKCHKSCGKNSCGTDNTSSSEGKQQKNGKKCHKDDGFSKHFSKSKLSCAAVASFHRTNKYNNGEDGKGLERMTSDSGNCNNNTLCSSNGTNNALTTNNGNSCISNGGIDYSAEELFRQNVIPLSTRDIYCLEKSWKGVALKMNETGLLLVTKLLELNPQYANFFETRNGLPVPKHLQLQTAAENFMYAMDKCIDYLDNPKRFFIFIRNMGEFHIGIQNFRVEYFLDFSDPFLYAVREILGERYTTHIEEIYIRTINYIIFKIIEAYENRLKKKTYR